MSGDRQKQFFASQVIALHHPPVLVSWLYRSISVTPTSSTTTLRNSTYQFPTPFTGLAQKLQFFFLPSAIIFLSSHLQPFALLQTLQKETLFRSSQRHSPQHQIPHTAKTYFTPLSTMFGRMLNIIGSKQVRTFNTNPITHKTCITRKSIPFTTSSSEEH